MTDDPDIQHFSRLLTQLTNAIICDHRQEKQKNFDSLPLPSRWHGQKRTIIDPPKVVNSDAIKKFKLDLQIKKRDAVETQERNRRAREEKEKLGRGSKNKARQRDEKRKKINQSQERA